MFQYDQDVLKEEHKLLVQKNVQSATFKSLDSQMTNMIAKLDQI